MIFFPHSDTSESTRESFFLAGSINNGTSPDWQHNIGIFLDKVGYDVFNPRRPDWNKSIDPSVCSEYLEKQIRWELENIKKADKVLFYFTEEGLSPVSLLELGLCISTNPSRLHVVCDDKYARRCNVITSCNMYGIEVFPNFEQFITKYEL